MMLTILSKSYLNLGYELSTTFPMKTMFSVCLFLIDVRSLSTNICCRDFPTETLVLQISSRTKQIKLNLMLIVIAIFNM